MNSMAALSGICAICVGSAAIEFLIFSISLLPPFSREMGVQKEPTFKQSFEAAQAF